MSAQKALERLRAEIVRLGKNGVHPAAVERLDFRAHGDRFHVFFFGSPFGEPYGLTIEALSANPIANSLLSFSLDGPDEGSNGTRNWDITRLATSAVPFQHCVICTLHMANLTITTAPSWPRPTKRTVPSVACLQRRPCWRR